MAVLAVWQCDRDGAMFQDKKAAEEYDRMLELAENISAVVEHLVPQLPTQDSEAIGLFLAKHREVLAKACKGKPELLTELAVSDEASPVSAADGEDAAASAGEAAAKEKKADKKVTPIKAKV